MFSSPWLSRQRSNAHQPAPPATVAPPTSPPASAHRRRRSMAVHRDLYAGGERDAVRCRPTALDGLDEILDLAPPLAPSARRPSAPAATFSFATPSSAAAFGLVPLAQRPPRRHSVEPRLSALPPPPPLAAPALARLRPRARSVARKPVPRAGLEDDLELVVAPDRDSGHVEALAPALEPERVIEERVRRMSVEDAQVGCGLGIGLQSIPAAIDPFLPASPATPISLSSAASSSLSRSTTLSSTSASSASSSRPFALIRKHAPARPTHAHDIILGCAAPRASNRVDDELVDAWMDLIAGRGDVDGVQSRRPALFAPRAVPRASRAAPQPFAPDVLAHLANALPPLVYTAAPPSAPILLPAPTVPSPVSLARSPLQHTSSSPPSPTSPIPRVPATHPAPEHRHSLVAPSLHGSETASDEYYSAVEGDPSPEWSPPPAAPTPSAHRLHKRSLSILRAPDGHTLPPLRLSFVPDPSAPTAEPPISPTSPVQPEQKRRLVDTAAVWTLEGDKPLPQQRPPRPPKSAARRGSVSVQRRPGGGRAESEGAAVLDGDGQRSGGCPPIPCASHPPHEPPAESPSAAVVRVRSPSCPRGRFARVSASSASEGETLEASTMRGLEPAVAQIARVPIPV